MSDLLLHPQTELSLSAYFSEPSQALCLIGPAGAGKKYLACHIAQRILGETNTDAIYTVRGETSISIEQIRDLQQYLKLKKPGTAAIKRVIIIEDSGKMGDEAQNALLKTLEEPPRDTVFILTSDGSTSLKPTIYSRLQQLRVLPISIDQAHEHFKSTDINKFYHLSGGYIGLLTALIHDSEHDLAKAIEEAKKLIASDSYRRLLEVDSLSKQKTYIRTLLYALKRVLGAVLAQTSDKSKIERLLKSLKAVYQAEIDLSKSANTKLLLTNLLLNL